LGGVIFCLKNNISQYAVRVNVHISIIDHAQALWLPNGKGRKIMMASK